MAVMDDRNAEPGGEELELDLIDDPAATLRSALQAGDRDRTMGAFRLLSAGGQAYTLESELALKLADLLEEAGQYEDAGRCCRMAAEADLQSPHAPDAIYRAAALLLGPAGRPRPGEQMLRYLVDNYPTHPLHEKSRQALSLLKAGQPWPPSDLPATAVPQAPPIDPATAPLAGETSPGVGPDEVFGGSLRERVEASVLKILGRPGSNRWRIVSLTYKILFVLVLAAFGSSWYWHDDHKLIDDIDPLLLEEPVLERVEKPSPDRIRFTRAGLAYAAVPLADYTIHGLVVSTRRHSYLEMESAQIMDVCLIWGQNVRSRVYQDPGLKFSNHISTRFRYCRTEWTGSVARRFDRKRLSNNHLFVADDEHTEQALRISPGDQVRIRGNLVKVLLLTPTDPDNAVWFPMESSLDPYDHHCEVILVDEVAILKTGNPGLRLAKTISGWSLALLFLLLVLRLVFLPVSRTPLR